jgi:energy-coupling factor transporter ATP-binding protein EcfA2
MQEKQSIVVVGDYVARDKYMLGVDVDEEVPLRKIVELVPKVPSLYAGPIPLLSVFQDLPTDTFIFSRPSEDGTVITSIARPSAVDLNTVSPTNATAYELLTEVQESVVLLGPSGSGKTTVLYRLVNDLLARDTGEMLLLDGSGAFGAKLSEVLAANVRIGPSSIAKLAGLQTTYRRTSPVKIDTLLIDHIYLMHESLAASAVQVANAIVEKYGPRRIIMTDLSAVAARRRGIRFEANLIELTAIGSDQIERLINSYQPYLRVSSTVIESSPDASTPEEALSRSITEEDAVDQLVAQISHGLQDVARSSAALRHVPDVFYAAMAKHPAPITQAEILDVLCEGDILSGAHGALPVAARLVELGFFVTRSNEPSSLFISDPALAKRIAAASKVSITADVQGPLIDVAARRLHASNDRDALTALKKILSATPKRSVNLADLDDLQRRASLAISYLRAGRSVDSPSLSRLIRLSSSLKRYSKNRTLGLRLREALFRDSVELDSWLGNLADEEIEFVWIPPGTAKFRYPRQAEDEFYFVSYGFYFASRPFTELQLWNLRTSLNIDSTRPARRNLLDPANMISWEQARELSALLASRIVERGYTCDLPSIPEWALARETLTSEGQVGNVIGTPTCLGHRCPVDLYASEGDPYFGGGILEWTRTSWGSDDLDNPRYRAPYDPADGREDPDAEGMRMLRGDAWLFRENELFCSCVLPVHARFQDVGFRLCLLPVESSGVCHSKVRVSLAKGIEIREQPTCELVARKM